MTDLTALNLRQNNAYQSDQIASLQTRLRLLETQELGASPSAIEAIQDTVGAMLTDSSSIDFSYDDGAATITAIIIAESVTATELASNAVTTVKILDANVTNAKLFDMAQTTVKGRAAGAGTGAPTDLTATQLNAIWGSADAFNANLLTLGVATDEGRGQMGTPALKIKGNNTLIYRESADSQPPIWEFLKRRSGTSTILSSGDIIGSLVWTGADSTTFGAVGARINVEVDGTAGSADMPGRIVFLTSADGSASPAESFRINSSQNVVFANGKYISVDQVRALDSDGLKLLDDGGNLGIIVEDGGYVGVGTSNPSVPFHVSSTDYDLVKVQRTGGTAPGTLDILRSVSPYSLSLTGSVIVSSDSLILNAGTGGEISLLTNNGTEAVRIDTSQNVTIANGKYIATDEVRARDSGGLALRDDGGNYGLFVEDGGYIGVGHASPDYLLDIDAGVTTTGINLEISGSRSGAGIALEIYNYAAASTSNQDTFSFALETSVTKRTAFNFIASFSTTTDASRTALVELQAANNGTLATRLAIAGNLVGIGTTTPAGMLTIDQSGPSSGLPCLELDQADDSEEFINFIGTIGTGNAIEAKGSKTLTTTHFVRIQIDGVGYRYIPVGTIA